MEIQDLVFDSHNNVAAFNQLIGSKSPSSCSITQYGVVGWNLYLTGNMTLFITNDQSPEPLYYRVPSALGKYYLVCGTRPGNVMRILAILQSDIHIEFKNR